MNIISFLMDGVNSCLSWFWDLMTNTGMWSYYITSFIIICIGSLVSPFIFRLGSGFSDKIQSRRIIDKYGNNVKPSDDEKWLW